ncbi:hypothetical protein HYH03_005567 [Edaphochlamys debaryana]|uniref:Strawberry notch n=1 Tax=Edaphochlamys debaryana TaxID=47281 RepID=A0A835Y4M7_9CHLO|nr:hypothetical protein HYH03_005567 [Edaphochlamys debaryana]|eukprot:KAG2496337.1 hypothetical protein HYH03_005567 [Edaphochlamys debaryana]
MENRPPAWQAYGAGQADVPVGAGGKRKKGAGKRARQAFAAANYNYDAPPAPAAAPRAPAVGSNEWAMNQRMAMEDAAYARGIAQQRQQQQARPQPQPQPARQQQAYQPGAAAAIEAAQQEYLRHQQAQQMILQQMMQEQMARAAPAAAARPAPAPAARPAPAYVPAGHPAPAYVPAARPAPVPVPAARPAPIPVPQHHVRQPPQRPMPAAGAGPSAVNPAVAAMLAAAKAAQAAKEAEENEAALGDGMEDNCFSAFATDDLEAAGLRPHPDKIAETTALASVKLPSVNYKMSLPMSVLSSGKISAAQFAAVRMACAKHETRLKDGSRAGFFLGDGPGVGKGRQIAATILENFAKGRKKAVWLSASSDLYHDASRDLRDIGALQYAGVKLLDLRTVKAGQRNLSKLPGWESGILFATYDLLISGEARSAKKKAASNAGSRRVSESGAAAAGAAGGATPGPGALVPWVPGGAGPGATPAVLGGAAAALAAGGHVEVTPGVPPGPVGLTPQGSVPAPAEEEVNEFGEGSRLHQLVEWLGGGGFEGLLVLDECHKAKNCLPKDNETADGRKFTQKESKTSRAVVELQRRCRDARVLYVSATGATESENLCYMERLGLWGAGTAYPGKKDFVTMLRTYGVRAMELVAMELKQSGAYLARTLSFEGVRFELVQVRTEGPFRATYDAAVALWQDLHEAMRSHGGGVDKKQKKEMMAQFFGAQLRFFRQLCTAGKVDEVERLTKEALANGQCVVIGLQSTGDARTAAYVEAHGGADAEFDSYSSETAAQEILVSLIDRYLPPGPEANGLRAKARALRLPENPLDDLIQRLGGPDAVAEMTGRTKRMERQGDGKWKYVPRSTGGSVDRANLTEKDSFQAGDKLVAIISDAASTGISLQADRSKPNQRQRVHITLELAWSADKTVQQLGRTHRSNQAQPPLYLVLSSDVSGEHRFASAVAGRLMQLGALTHGDRNAVSAVDVLAGSNFHTTYGPKALSKLYKVLRGIADPLSAVDGLAAITPEWLRAELAERGLEPGSEAWGAQRNARMEEFVAEAMDELEAVGLLKDDGEGGLAVSTGMMKEKSQAQAGGVNRLLNRLLGVRVEMQKQIFQYFTALLDNEVVEAKRKGEYETGIVRPTCGDIKCRKREVIYLAPDSSTPTAYLDFQLDRGIPWEEAWRIYSQEKEEDEETYTHFVTVTNQSNDVVTVALAIARTERGRRVVGRGRRRFTAPAFWRLVRPATGYGKDISSEEFRRYRAVHEDRVKGNWLRRHWEDEYRRNSDQRKQHLHLVAGSLLPLLPTLDRTLRSSAKRQQPMTVMRVVPTDGSPAVLGIALPSDQVAEAVLREIRALQPDRPWLALERAAAAAANTAAAAAAPAAAAQAQGPGQGGPHPDSGSESEDGSESERERGQPARRDASESEEEDEEARAEREERKRARAAARRRAKAAGGGGGGGQKEGQKRQRRRRDAELEAGPAEPEEEPAGEEADAKRQQLLGAGLWEESAFLVQQKAPEPSTAAPKRRAGRPPKATPAAATPLPAAAGTADADAAAAATGAATDELATTGGRRRRGRPSVVGSTVKALKLRKEEEEDDMEVEETSEEEDADVPSDGDTSEEEVVEPESEGGDAMEQDDDDEEAEEEAPKAKGGKRGAKAKPAKAADKASAGRGAKGKAAAKAAPAEADKAAAGKAAAKDGFEEISLLSDSSDDDAPLRRPGQQAVVKTEAPAARKQAEAVMAVAAAEEDGDGEDSADDFVPAKPKGAAAKPAAKAGGAAQKAGSRKAAEPAEPAAADGATSDADTVGEPADDSGDDSSGDEGPGAEPAAPPAEAKPAEAAQEEEEEGSEDDDDVPLRLSHQRRQQQQAATGVAAAVAAPEAEAGDQGKAACALRVTARRARPSPADSAGTDTPAKARGEKGAAPEPSAASSPDTLVAAAAAALATPGSVRGDGKAGSGSRRAQDPDLDLSKMAAVFDEVDEVLAAGDPAQDPAHGDGGEILDPEGVADLVGLLGVSPAAGAKTPAAKASPGGGTPGTAKGGKAGTPKAGKGAAEEEEDDDVSLGLDAAWRLAQDEVGGEDEATAAVAAAAAAEAEAAAAAAAVEAKARRKEERRQRKEEKRRVEAEAAAKAAAAAEAAVRTSRSGRRVRPSAALAVADFVALHSSDEDDTGAGNKRTLAAAAAEPGSEGEDAMQTGAGAGAGTGPRSSRRSRRSKGRRSAAAMEGSDSEAADEALERELEAAILEEAESSEGPADSDGEEGLGRGLFSDEGEEGPGGGKRRKGKGWGRKGKRSAVKARAADQGKRRRRSLAVREASPPKAAKHQHDDEEDEDMPLVPPKKGAEAKQRAAEPAEEAQGLEDSGDDSGGPATAGPSARRLRPERRRVLADSDDEEEDAAMAAATGGADGTPAAAEAAAEAVTPGSPAGASSGGRYESPMEGVVVTPAATTTAAATSTADDEPAAAGAAAAASPRSGSKRPASAALAGAATPQDIARPKAARLSTDAAASPSTTTAAAATAGAQQQTERSPAGDAGSAWPAVFRPGGATEVGGGAKPLSRPSLDLSTATPPRATATPGGGAAATPGGAAAARTSPATPSAGAAAAGPAATPTAAAAAGSLAERLAEAERRHATEVARLRAEHSRELLAKLAKARDLGRARATEEFNAVADAAKAAAAAAEAQRQALAAELERERAARQAAEAELAKLRSERQLQAQQPAVTPSRAAAAPEAGKEPAAGLARGDSGVAAAELAPAPSLPSAPAPEPAVASALATLPPPPCQPRPLPVPDRDAVAAAVSAYGGGVTAAALCRHFEAAASSAAVEAVRGAVRQALQELVDEFEVMREGAGATSAHVDVRCEATTYRVL